MPRTRYAAVAVVLLITTTGGAAFVYTASEPGTALTVTGLSVSDDSATIGPSGEVTGVRLDTTLKYEWSASHAPDSVTITLYANPTGGSPTVVDSQTIADPGLNGSGQTTLSGGLIDAGVIDPVSVAEGQTTGEELELKAVLELTRGGERIAIADAATTAHYSVTREEITVSSDVAGSGSLAVQTGG